MCSFTSKGLINTSCHLAEQTPGFVPTRWATGLKMQVLTFSSSCSCKSRSIFSIDLFVHVVDCTFLMVLFPVISETETGKATRELKSAYLGSKYLISHTCSVSHC